MEITSKQIYFLEQFPEHITNHAQSSLCTIKTVCKPLALLRVASYAYHAT
jgi:hypothetical protein